MDDSAHRDEPAPAAKETRPADARADASLRESVADAIPTIAPHSPRQPSQIPPWPEKSVTADPAGEVLIGADVQAETQDALEPEVSVTPFSSEPSPPPDEIAGHDGSQERRAANAASEVLAHPVAQEPLAPEADAVGDAGSPETVTTEPEREAAAAPTAEGPPSTAGDALPGHEEDLIVGEPAVEFSPAPRVGPEADTESNVAHPAAANADILSTPPSESADGPAKPDASLIDVSVSAEPIWHDASDALRPTEHPEIQAAGYGVDTSPPAAQPAPVREEQIWSGPQAIEPSARRPEAEPTDTQPGPTSEIDARSELEPPTEQHAPQATLVAAPHAPAQAPPHVPSPLAAVWPSTSLQAPGRTGEPVRYLRLVVRLAGGVVLALTATVLLLVVLYRWVDPPTSTLMLGQRLTGTEIEQTWRPIERISPHLVQAVILSEDGAFCRHRGVDWSALEEAIESSRGGSTITMQVVKNLFLWPARSYIRKALEIMLAYVVEVVWPKERVLEIYLNIAEWGPGVFGAEAAARNHFGKAASQLTAEDAALLAVSLPSPIERQAGYPDQQTRRLASNLLLRMRAVRTAQRCVRVRRAGT